MSATTPSFSVGPEGVPGVGVSEGTPTEGGAGVGAGVDPFVQADPASARVASQTSTRDERRSSPAEPRPTARSGRTPA